MTLSERRRQKKLEKNKKKRQLMKKIGSMGFGARSTAASYAKYPLYECLVPSGLFETGIGRIVATRQPPSGEIALSAFVVDVFCLGVKNAFFKVVSKEVYHNTIMPRLVETHEGQHFENTHPSCMRKLIEGAVDYAGDLGFSPHPDYKKVKAIFGDIDAGACPVKYVFGQEGMPMYIQGPNESITQAKKIVDQLAKRCGEGKYHYLVMLDDGSSE
jgi:hypothetical protein